MDISIIVPLLNEAESIPELFAWIGRVMTENKFSYEVIFVDDGSTDDSWKIIEGLRADNPEIVKGIKAACSGVEIDYMQFQQIINGFMEKRSAAIGEEMIKKSAEFLENIAKEEGVVKTESGLMYKIVKEGEGIKPAERDTVEVDYEGKNLDGKVFDSSYDRGQTATFPLNGVIKGWTEGMQYIGEGGEIMLYIPAELAYGDRGAGSDIHPNEALTFKVELKSVKPYVEKEVK